MDGYAVEESDENWLGQKIRHKAQPQKTGQNAKDPREYCIMPQPFAPSPGWAIAKVCD